MTATATASSRPRAGERVELRRYRLPDGERILVGQRIDGRVALIDTPAGGDGQVLLVERHVENKAELDGIVTEYADRSERVGMPALIASRRLGDNLVEAIR